MLAAIRARTGKPIRYVINTHGHPDHVFGNGAFVLDGTTFVGEPATRARCAGQFYLDAFRPNHGRAVDQAERVGPPTLLVSGTLRLDIRRPSLVLRAWPAAHTPTAISQCWTKDRDPVAGDLVF